MNPQAIARAEGHFRDTIESFARLDRGTSPADVQRAWSLFLMDGHRVVGKLMGGVPKGHRSAVLDRIRADQSSDPLVAYLFHARHADEHGIQPVSVVDPGGFGIRNAAEGPALVNVSVQNGVITDHGSVNTHVQVYAARCKLIAVRNRGVVYGVPSRHLGADLPDQEPRTVANSFLSYLADRLHEAAQEAE
jgi:hypothetical protein